MAVRTMDWYDAMLGTLYGFCSAVTVGIATVELFDTSFSDALFSLGGSSITVASAISLVILALVYFSNDNGVSLGAMDPFYKLAVGGTVFLTVAIPFIPFIEDLATTNDFARLIAVSIMAIGFGSVGYLK